MAELDVGQHCQVEHCRQRDFLPFVCDGCSGIFCLEHRSRESHSCPEITVISERPKADKHISYPCSFKDCAERELVPVICPHCEKNFCLRHRHQTDHECKKLEIPKPHMAATQKLVRDIIGNKEKSKPMFFCHRWSIGKVIDFAASLASLKNDNNKLTAKKLRLCHISSGEALPLDHTLETWTTKEDCPLYNGGSIILEYLNNEEQFLKNVDSYLE
ncbi:AN1-type zinc finger protein 1 isoform X3 [Manis pentadactyla]|uniref:AN1-type zinc finger protein 1 isoform X3 n=1 Tax=Manis pentadactyla TaxID=143292 RepID=UPI00255CD261|nr:AN1-type zinc finger protein 1 isoform X3 [Manis pentadactyla]